MTYARPADRAGALRLHLNENTGGCSPAVIDAIRLVTAEEVAIYPDYALLSRECAEYLEVEEARLVLTNGLDEGLLAATVTAFRVQPSATSPAMATSPAAASLAAAPSYVPEAIIPMPAFDMSSVFVKAAGGRVVPVPPREDFGFPAREIYEALTPATRIVFLTSPNNPTGQLISRNDLLDLARRVPSEVMIFIDEAYYDFCGQTFLPELEAHPNVLIGRTFAKAHGLAGLRAGCVLGDPDRLANIRSVVPPYSLSVFAVAGWRAALRDRRYLEWYRLQVEESRTLLYAACDRLGLRYWKSAGNFVLIDVSRIGDPTVIADAMAASGVLVRDRSRDAGCAGCIRITAGVVAHTEAAIEALEGLCAAA